MVDTGSPFSLVDKRLIAGDRRLDNSRVATLTRMGGRCMPTMGTAWCRVRIDGVVDTPAELHVAESLPMGVAMVLGLDLISQTKGVRLSVPRDGDDWHVAFGGSSVATKPLRKTSETDDYETQFAGHHWTTEWRRVDGPPNYRVAKMDNVDTALNGIAAQIDQRAGARPPASPSSTQGVVELGAKVTALLSRIDSLTQARGELAAAVHELTRRVATAESELANQRSMLANGSRTGMSPAAGMAELSHRTTALEARMSAAEACSFAPNKSWAAFRAAAYGHLGAIDRQLVGLRDAAFENHTSLETMLTANASRLAESVNRKGGRICRDELFVDGLRRRVAALESSVRSASREAGHKQAMLLTNMDAVLSNFKERRNRTSEATETKQLLGGNGDDEDLNTDSGDRGGQKQSGSTKPRRTAPSPRTACERAGLVALEARLIGGRVAQYLDNGEYEPTQCHHDDYCCCVDLRATAQWPARRAQRRRVREATARPRRQNRVLDEGGATEARPRAGDRRTRAWAERA